MGLDIYAGTLTRYYTMNWKNTVQQWAEENGFTYNRITPDQQNEPDASEDEELSTADVQEIAENWRDQVLKAICQPGHTPYAPWPEDNERPYYTGRPDWDAFGAMLLITACHIYKRPVPPTVKDNWNYRKHPLIARLARDQKYVWSLLRGAVLWIPVPEDFLFQAPLLTNNTDIVSTTGGLRKELEKLNQLIWQADEATILSWAQTEGYPSDGTTMPHGLVNKKSFLKRPRYNTESLAKFSFSIFWQAVNFSEKNQVPILLD